LSPHNTTNAASRNSIFQRAPQLPAVMLITHWDKEKGGLLARSILTRRSRHQDLRAAAPRSQAR
jgi:hypothetical protein